MSTPIRVLVVDDEPFIASALQRQLTRRGFAVETFTSPLALVARLDRESEPFDIVISDYRMPEMDGLELLGEVGRRFPRAVRVIVSGCADDESVELAGNPVFDLFACKPWNGEQFARDLVRLHSAGR